MLKCWSTVNCSTGHIFWSQSDFPCALVQIFSWTPLQQSLIWSKKQFYFFTLSPSNVFLAGSWQQLSAKQHPEKSSHYQQRRNLSHSFSVDDKSPFFCLFSSLGHLSMLFAKGSAAVKVCLNTQLIQSPLDKSFCFAGANSLSLLAAETKQCIYNEVPKCPPSRTLPAILHLLLIMPDTISGPWHLTEDPLPATTSKAKARHHEEYKQYARLLSCNQSQETPQNYSLGHLESTEYFTHKQSNSSISFYTSRVRNSKV